MLHTKQRSRLKRRLCIPLIVTMLAAMLLTGQPKIMPVMAADITNGIKIGTALANNNAEATTIVRYGGHEWYVIGAVGTGIAQAAGENSLTLLYKYTSGTAPTLQYMSTNTAAYYVGSVLQGAMTAFYNEIPYAERSHIVANDLDQTLENKENPFPPPGTLVKDQYVWPLSNLEVIQQTNMNRPGIHSTILTYPVSWWLRSVPGTHSSVNKNPHYISQAGAVTTNAASNSTLGFRPAMKVSLDDALMLSDAEGNGKDLAVPGGGAVDISSHGQKVKLTMIDDNQTLDVISAPIIEQQNMETLSFGYENATAGDGQFVSYLLEKDNNELYYNKLANSSDTDRSNISIPMNGLTDGTYTLKIFSEQVNDMAKTDFASTPVTMTVDVVNGKGSIGNDYTGKIDDTKPTVINVTPDGTAEPLSGSIEISFNEVMDQTLSTGTVSLNGTALPGTQKSWSGDGKTFTISYDNLSYDTEYTINITGFKDLVGNTMLDDSDNTFKTAYEPLPPALGILVEPKSVLAGQSLSLSAPTMNDNHTIITRHGWQLSANGSTGWEDFDPTSAMKYTQNGYFLRYFAVNGNGTTYSNSVPITVDKWTSNLTISASPDDMQTYPGNITLSAALTGANNIEGQAITFTVNGVSYTAITDVTGKATYLITAPDAGVYSFGASFAGDDASTAATAKDITDYTVKKGTQTGLDIIENDQKKTYGDDDFTLSTSGGMGDGEIIWTTDDDREKYISLTDNKNGTATVHIKGATNDGPVTVIASKSGGSNYKDEIAKIVVTVEKSILTVTADNKSKKYGEANPALTLSYSGFAYDEGEDVLLTKPTVSTTAGKDSPIANYPITVSGGISDNYSFNYVPGMLTVNAVDHVQMATAIQNKTSNTGDNSHMYLWFLLFAVSLIGIVLMVISGKRRSHKTKTK